MYGKMFRVMTAEEAVELRDAILPLEWKEGRARTKELTGTIKQNVELKPGEDGPLVTALSQQVSTHLTKSEDFLRDTMMMKMTGLKFNKYGNTGTYHRHTDAPWMGPVRTDFAVTVFLTPKDEYVGGDLHIETPYDGEKVIKGDAGEAYVYECGCPHWVDPVTEGYRVSAVGWIQSHFGDPREREILSSLLRISRKVEGQMDYTAPDDFLREVFVDIGKVHSGLNRMWTYAKNAPTG